MQAVDASLAGAGLKPFQRPLHVPRLLWEAFQWSGDILPPDTLADHPGFSGAVLMAKVHRWYKIFYGDQLNMPGVVGHFPYRLANAVWKVRAPVVYGTVSFFVDRDLARTGTKLGSRAARATANVLGQVQKLPEGLAARLSDEQLSEFATFFRFAMRALMWRQSAMGGAMFEMAYDDYDASTEDVVGGRYGQARWGAQQAVEKTFKGLLSLAGKPFPTGGPNGHNLKHLSDLLKDAFAVALPEALVALASCSAAVRYGEQPSSEGQALSANHAVLGVLEELSKSAAIAQLLVGSAPLAA
jgi:HEPN domain-containing protein